MKDFCDAFNSALGLNSNPQNLTFFQIGLRAVIVFLASLIIVRIGNKRFLANKTAFDAILAFILGSMLARAINGNVAFFPTLGGGFVLITLHRFIAFLSRDSHWFGNLVKGHTVPLIKDGEVNRDAMRKHDLSEHDLLEDLRLNGNVEDPSKVKAAYFERDGQITVVKETS
ncbi:MAG TPA: YetF domain-containing protein [Verrucomicrobiae bacterium]|nr:YetF domain-containing protein [Verrucomicrobiae bacterium]